MERPIPNTYLFHYFLFVITVWLRSHRMPWQNDTQFTVKTWHFVTLDCIEGASQSRRLVPMVNSLTCRPALRGFSATSVWTPRNKARVSARQPLDLSANKWRSRRVWCERRLRLSSCFQPVGIPFACLVLGVSDPNQQEAWGARS